MIAVLQRCQQVAPAPKGVTVARLERALELGVVGHASRGVGLAQKESLKSFAVVTALIFYRLEPGDN